MEEISYVVNRAELLKSVRLGVGVHARRFGFIETGKTGSHEAELSAANLERGDTIRAKTRDGQQVALQLTGEVLKIQPVLVLNTRDRMVDGGPTRPESREPVPIEDAGYESEPEPDEDSITTRDHRDWFQYGKIYYQGDANSLRRKMDADQFWPSVFFISDHGNAHLITDFGEKRRHYRAKTSKDARRKDRWPEL